MGRAAIWFPLVGAAIGGILALTNYALTFFFQPFIVSTIVIALWAAITGALHLDGLADCCDGLLAPVSTERRLEIMRDPRLGSFGVIGLVLFLILKVMGLTFASLDTPLATVPMLLFAPAVARWLILIVAMQPNARPGGMGADFALGLKWHVFALAAIVPVALLIIYFNPRLLVAAALAHLVTVGIIAFARSRIGGVTGDVFGLAVEISELVVLLVFSAFL
jgi:adenosylcobinamide-GDP ribazoletransferase